jgi:tRNA G18 (ribose-2'-O)-methylase SpoU
MGGVELSNFQHPEQAVYLLGAEDYGLPEKIMQKCHQIISIESVRLNCFNVAVAGSIVMYDRYQKGL